MLRINLGSVAIRYALVLSLEARSESSQIPEASTSQCDLRFQRSWSSSELYTKLRPQLTVAKH